MRAFKEGDAVEFRFSGVVQRSVDGRDMFVIKLDYYNQTLVAPAFMVTSLELQGGELEEECQDVIPEGKAQVAICTSKERIRVLLLQAESLLMHLRIDWTATTLADVP